MYIVLNQTVPPEKHQCNNHYYHFSKKRPRYVSLVFLNSFLHCSKTTTIYLHSYKISAVSEHTNKTGHSPDWKNILCLEKDSHWCHAELKRPSKSDSNRTTSTGIMGSKYITLVEQHTETHKTNQSQNG